MGKVPRRGRSGGRPSYLLQLYIIISSAVLVASVLIYTQSLIHRMERQDVLVSRVLARFAAMSTFRAAEDPELATFFREVMRGVNFPIVITDERGVPMVWKGIGIDEDAVSYEEFQSADPSHLPPGPLREALRIAGEFDRRNEPIPLTGLGESHSRAMFHYGASEFVPELRLVPLLQLGTVAILVFLGYLGYRSVKVGEQRSIWVGMAKETAHQLGTPMSSLLGWMELLRAKLGDSGPDREAAGPGEGDPGGEATAPEAELAPRGHPRAPGPDAGGNGRGAEETDGVPAIEPGLRRSILGILDEMQQDVNRTAQVASRFETIGSIPRLQPGEVSRVARETVDYFRRRWSRLGSEIELRENYARTPSVYLNRDLLQWVFENLLRNAMDAMEGGRGLVEITTAYRPEDGSVEVRFTDSGRGMTPGELKRAFEPGFTTKSRGWGLGLALAKRIVEEYHGGHIWARSAGRGKGTTFHMTFPV